MDFDNDIVIHLAISPICIWANRRNNHTVWYILYRSAANWHVINGVTHRERWRLWNSLLARRVLQRSGPVLKSYSKTVSFSVIPRSSPSHLCVCVRACVRACVCVSSRVRMHACSQHHTCVCGSVEEAGAGERLWEWDTYFLRIYFIFIVILNVPSWVLSPCVKGF